MPGPFDDAFRSRMGRVIARIENQSHVELVVLIKSRADNYPAYPLGAGTAFAFLALSYFRFAPALFDEWIIYGGTIAAFLVGAILTGTIPSVLRLAVGRARLAKSSEILARAVFQKAGIQNTRDRTGVLIFVALFERRILIIPDRGAEAAIPPAEWTRIRDDLEKIFRARKPGDDLLARLEGLSEVFRRYIPQNGNDVNELPDNLDIDL